MLERDLAGAVTGYLHFFEDPGKSLFTRWCSEPNANPAMLVAFLT
jgi:hypothetical protein